MASILISIIARFTWMDGYWWHTSGHDINYIAIQFITEYFCFNLSQREELDGRSCPAFSCSSKEWREKRKRSEKRGNTVLMTLKQHDTHCVLCCNTSKEQSKIWRKRRLSEPSYNLLRDIYNWGEMKHKRCSAVFHLTFDRQHAINWRHCSYLHHLITTLPLAVLS